jgi:hypothetical protein
VAQVALAHKAGYDEVPNISFDFRNLHDYLLHSFIFGIGVLFNQVNQHFVPDAFNDLYLTLHCEPFKQHSLLNESNFLREIPSFFGKGDLEQ